MVKCPYCDREFKTYNGLTKHMFKYNAHGDGITMKLLGNLLRLGKDNTPLVLELYGTREFLGKILIQMKRY